MDYWHKSFKYRITPKRGPMPQMSSLIDAKGALLELPQGFLRRPHWLRAGHALLAASQTGRPIDIQWAFDTIVAAVDEEGWFDLGRENITTEPQVKNPAAPDELVRLELMISNAKIVEKLTADINELESELSHRAKPS
jgi:hypothetical protein